MSLRWWMRRAMRAETRAGRAETRARKAEMLAAAAMKRLSDRDLLELREEMGGERRDDN